MKICRLATISLWIDWLSEDYVFKLPQTVIYGVKAAEKHAQKGEKEPAFIIGIYLYVFPDSIVYFQRMYA